MYTVEIINKTISLLFLALYSYQIFYCIVPFLKTEHVESFQPLRRYAVLICARNEGHVIQNLLDSLNNQDYPRYMYDIFVVADNCTDNTAQVAAESGAVVYTRHNTKHMGKGYALQFLTDQIVAEYTDDYYDGYFVFDADNVVAPDYISQMNTAFGCGNHIVTSYRNSKNYGDNWISAGYSLWFIRESQFLNRSRHLLNVSACIGGTGFLFSKKILQEQKGWHFFLLTEDIEFAAQNIINGYKIAYCEKAMFYDEQPTDFKQSYYQRLRWRKGFLQVIQNYGGDLCRGALSDSFSCYDMLANIAPRAVLSLLCMAVNFTYIIFLMASGQCIQHAVINFVLTIFGGYRTLFYTGVLTTITEWGNISCPWYKKILYVFTFPLFMFTYLPISVVALFAKVSWRPIKHSDSKTLSEIKNKKSIAGK